MKIYGLTGGIATGKSTVSQMFREAGVPVIDADVIAREIVAPGEPALEEIALRFPGVLDANGQLNRAELAARIFADPRERDALNAITHPKIRERARLQAEALAKAGHQVALYDAPLLIESGSDRFVEGVILVICPKALQLQRLMRRDGLDAAEAQARIDAQMPLEKKRAFATWVIDNSADAEITRAQVEAIIAAWAM